MKTTRDARRRRPAARHDAYWIYGRHAVAAAVANPRRRIRRLLLSDGARPPGAPVPVETASAAELRSALPPGAAHQGVAALADPLPAATLDDVAGAAEGAARAAAVALDRVTDPRNVGAILRSAAAFGAAAALATSRHAPAESGALAKAASGALETVPLARVPNLARALARLRTAGFWTVGLDAGAPSRLGRSELPARCVFVLGAEGHGIRRLTREACDLTLAIPMTGAADSLNVATAAAVALYEWARQAPIVDGAAAQLSGPPPARNRA